MPSLAPDFCKTQLATHRHRGFFIRGGSIEFPQAFFRGGVIARSQPSLCYPPIVLLCDYRRGVTVTRPLGCFDTCRCTRRRTTDSSKPTQPTRRAHPRKSQSAKRSAVAMSCARVRQRFGFTLPQYLGAVGESIRNIERSIADDASLRLHAAGDPSLCS